MILQSFPTVCRIIRDFGYFYPTQRKGSYRPKGVGLDCPFRVYENMLTGNEERNCENLSQNV